MKDRLALLLAAFWWGSLTTIVFMVVPMLFARLGNPAVAGNFDGQLFEAQIWVDIGSGMYIVQWLCTGVLLWRMGARAPR